ncbi:hypothetical protein A3Q56_03274 [Intoshia linei]|uniref:Uncharacterized protein n=1 Tax=Intoshia linei TaxID=1819745 RepID=A0A177B6E1_9BILA|nr:hypothetical protein A3Q56_03274 [Intoshia linei]
MSVFEGSCVCTFLNNTVKIGPDIQISIFDKIEVEIKVDSESMNYERLVFKLIKPSLSKYENVESSENALKRKILETCIENNKKIKI